MSVSWYQPRRWCLPALTRCNADVYIQRNEELLLKVRPDLQHPVLSVLFPMSMQDPSLFKCFLVGAQSLYEWRRFPRQAKPSQTMMCLQSEAITSLQKRLTLPAAHLDDGLVLSVLHLMVADVRQTHVLLVSTPSQAIKSTNDVSRLVSEIYHR